MVVVEWSAHALTCLDELDPIIRQRVLAKISWLEENFADTIPEKLHRELKGLYKVRIGDYRAVYSVRADMITIEAVGHRRDIYK
jgi:mRNA interferase RelE/StbE